MFNRKDHRIIGTLKTQSHGFASNTKQCKTFLVGKAIYISLLQHRLFQEKCGVVNTGFRLYSKVLDYIKHQTSLNFLKETWNPMCCMCFFFSGWIYVILIAYRVYEYRTFSNVIPTSFCRFLKRKKKKLVRGSNPHLSFNRPLRTRQTDWIILDVTNALTDTRLTRRVWSGHLTTSGTNAPQLISVAAF